MKEIRFVVSGLLLPLTETINCFSSGTVSIAGAVSVTKTIKCFSITVFYTTSIIAKRKDTLSGLLDKHY